MAQLVQYGTFALQNIGFLEGAYPIAAWYSTALFLYTRESISLVLELNTKQDDRHPAERADRFRACDYNNTQG